VEAEIRLEQLGNQLAAIYDVDVLCGYENRSMIFAGHNLDFKRICAEHSVVFTQKE